MASHGQTCDFCGSAGNGNLGNTGDERSMYFYFNGVRMFWDGVCRQGSRAYFADYDTETLLGLIQMSEEVLDSDPIRWKPPYDSLEVHARKIFISDEVWRGTQEVNYRILEA